MNDPPNTRTPPDSSLRKLEVHTAVYQPLGYHNVFPVPQGPVFVAGRQRYLKVCVFPAPRESYNVPSPLGAGMLPPSGEVGIAGLPSVQAGMEAYAVVSFPAPGKSYHVPSSPGADVLPLGSEVGMVAFD
jgi:hypothetical protein